MKKKYIVWVIVFIFLVACFFVALIKVNSFLETIIHKKKEVVVPMISGLSFDVAKDLLSKSNLGIVVTSEVFDPKIESGRIVEQSPNAGFVVREGNDVNVVLSKGFGGATIPNVVGLNHRNAEVNIKNLGFIVGQEEFIYSFSVPEGDVIDQSPAPFVVTRMGININLKISKGIPPDDIKLMPKLIGIKKEAASVLLDMLPLKYEIQYVKVSKENEKNVVLSQNPQEDTEVNQDVSVNFTVGE